MFPWKHLKKLAKVIIVVNGSDLPLIWVTHLMTTPSMADFRYRSTEHSAFSWSSLAVVMHFSTPTGIGRIVRPDTWPWTFNKRAQNLSFVYSQLSNGTYLINCALQAVSLWENIDITKSHFGLLETYMLKYILCNSVWEKISLTRSIYVETTYTSGQP